MERCPAIGAGILEAPVDRVCAGKAEQTAALARPSALIGRRGLSLSLS
jgi:hypothetical protein